MFSNIENLKIENIHKGTSKVPTTVADRNSNSFILRTKGNICYNFYDYSINHNEGEIIFLPKGCSYETSSLSPVPCEYVSIRFSADLENAEPFSCSMDNFTDRDEFLNTIYDIWKFGGNSEHYKCYSIFYNLLSYLEFCMSQPYIDKNKFNIISPAVAYLKKHIYDPQLNIDFLAEMCNVSGTYFRNIFKANFAQSPQKYILGKRLSHAKTIIDTGDYNSISEIALSVGYNDPLYFSRAFKKKYGLSPSEYAKV